MHQRGEKKGKRRWGEIALSTRKKERKSKITSSFPLCFIRMREREEGGGSGICTSLKIFRGGRGKGRKGRKEGGERVLLA